MRSYWKIKLWAKFVNHFDVFDNLWSRKIAGWVFQDFEGLSSLNLYHCKQLRFPDYRLFHSTHDSFNNSKTHRFKTLGQRVPTNPEIVIVSSGKGLN